MGYLGRFCLAATLLWSFAAIAHDAASAIPAPFADWIAQGLAENRAGAQQADLASCQHSLENDIASHPRTIQGMPPTGDFVLYLSSNPGWGSFHLMVLSIGRHGGTLLYGKGKPPTATPVTGRKVASIQHTLHDMRPYRYAYAPGVMDGDCRLVVMQLQGDRTVALLPPGARMDGDKGDPLDAFLRWAEPLWPKESEDD